MLAQRTHERGETAWRVGVHAPVPDEDIGREEVRVASVGLCMTDCK